MKAKSVTDHDGLYIVIKDHCQGRVLKAADNNRLIDKGILDTAQSAKYVAYFRPDRTVTR